MEDRGKMSYSQAISGLDQTLRDLKNVIFNNIALLCAITLATFITVVLAFTTTSFLICIIYVIASIILVIIGFCIFINIIMNSRIYNTDKKRFLVMIKEENTDSPEALYCRFGLLAFIKIAISHCESAQFHAEIPKKMSNDVDVHNMTTLMIWDLLKTTYPNIHACSVHDPKTMIDYLFHINDDGTATFTTVNCTHSHPNLNCWKYRTLDIPLDEKFCTKIDEYMSTPTLLEKQATLEFLDWDDALSISTFYRTAFPEHCTSLA